MARRGAGGGEAEARRSRGPGQAALGWLGALCWLAAPGAWAHAQQPSAPLRPIAQGESQRAALLYGQHCAACHGKEGDGNGSAARFLEPRPRNLRDGRYRLITSSTTPVASAADVLAVLERGMPGSSMPSWAHLTKLDRMLLVGQVLQFRQDGLRDKAAAQLKEEGEDITPEAVRQYADKLAQQPGAPLAVAAKFDATAGAARGKLVFQKSCAACHGAEGKGDGAQKMLTSEGFEQRPRDLTRGIFKGNHDPASLFRRIRLGLPGSAMPSNGQNTDAEIADLVQYVLSLSDEPTRQSFIARRQRIAAVRVAQVFRDPVDARWNAVSAASATLFPLWWRDFDDPKFQVQAIHDGTTLALRLTYRDRTCNDDPRRTDAFEDMAAVQFYRGASEPFLGMGDASNPVEAWLWRASWQRADLRDGPRYVDEYPFDGRNYNELFRGKQAGFPDPFTARAAGNLNADGGRTLSATSLAAKGQGTATLRPRPAQQVVARSVRRPEGWSVTLARPLQVDAGAGCAIEPGGKLSVAFAVWDGAQRDRNGQKMISIWNELELQP